MASRFGHQNHWPVRFIAAILVVVMITTPITNFVIAESQVWHPNAEQEWVGETTFAPNPNQTHTDTQNSNLLEIPANHTITEANLSLSSWWNSVPYQNVTFGSNETQGWNGTSVNLVADADAELLTLEKLNSSNIIEDFEVVSAVPAGGWLSSGQDSAVWVIVNGGVDIVSNSSMSIPTNGVENTSFLASTGTGDLVAGMEACIRSPIIDIPRVINNYSLSFKHWLALDSSDYVAVEFLNEQSVWTELPFASQLELNANSNSWVSVNISLDNEFSQLLTNTYLRFCLSTSQITANRGGWFIDHLELYNQGDEMGAWFHGNFSGDYLPYAASEFILPANLTNFPYLDELEVNLNWDIQGYLHDYLIVEFSFDDGKSWNTISGNYGIPGLGVWHNGNLHYTESNGWIPVFLPIVHNFTNSGGLNRTLFKFTVYTNAGINYGGATSSGWEGIAIDQLVFHQNRGGINPLRQVFKDFNTIPMVSQNSSDGWLQSVRPANNQWQWTQNMGLSSETYQLFSFNDHDELPLGWAVSSQSDSRWEHGKLPINKIYGPDTWVSGEYGVGIALGGKYDNEMYTHLISPEYLIPTHSSTRLSFNSWVCTEANWDGGAVSVSTDGGLNWSYLPPQIGDFHDQISTANTNSPFYGEGIFDGSTIPGNCRNSSLPFELKQYDISNLSGQEARFRYSFFSDQLVELDGWYVDDAGIEIDIFSNNGSWLSQPLNPDPNFGWGQIDGLVNEPLDTNVRFDVIDTTTGALIPGYSNLTLPIILRLNPAEYGTIQIQARMSTNNHFVTPSIAKIEMGVSSYFSSYHAKHLLGYHSNNGDIIISNKGIISAVDELHLTLPTVISCPVLDTKIITRGENVSYASSYFANDYVHLQDDISISEFSNSRAIPTLIDNIAITIDEATQLSDFRYSPECVLPTKNLTLAVGEASNEFYSDALASSSNSGFFTESFSSVTIEGSAISPDQYGNYLFTLEPNQMLELNYHVLGYVDEVSDVSLSIQLIAHSNDIGGLYMSGSNVPIANYSSVHNNHNLVATNGCQNRQVMTNNFLANAALSECTISLSTSSSVAVKIMSIDALSPVRDVTVELDIDQLNTVKHLIENTSTDSTIVLPLFAKTDFGSVTTTFDYKSYLHLIDRIESIDKPQWLPGQELTIQTSHVRFNPNTMSVSGYGIDRVELIAASDASSSNAQFVIEATQLYSDSPNLNVRIGANKLTINEHKSTVFCDQGYCLITWVLQSNWRLNDIDDIAWMANSFDLDGLATGPTTVVRETQFNEIENDLEVFEFSVHDADDNLISDWTNQQWPYRLSDSNSLAISGKVRFEGINNALVSHGDAQVEIRLTAVPPVNVSGGVDEWHAEDIIWTNSWFTEVESGGLFSAQIMTPERGQVPSNTSIQISVHISRVGPAAEGNPDAEDRTSVNLKTRFIFDTGSPTVSAINIYDPAGIVNADGHVWTLNQDIPLQVVIEDVEGLDTELVVYTWAEYADDSNGDAIMDPEEYRITTVSVNYASNIAVLDIPAISWQEVKGPFESGRLSIVLAIDDLAGNSLQNGGNFGIDQDAATIIVQDQFQTLMDTSALSLDLVDGQILPSHKHTFSYGITDYNGIESIGRISIALVGRDTPEQCYIDYFPRGNLIEFDRLCYESAPIIKVSKIPNLQKWLVETEFVLSWSAVNSNPNLSGIPSLKVFDDGQDLQLGTSYLRGLSWAINAELSLDTIQFVDRTKPIGSTVDAVLWASPSDLIIASSNLYHNGTDIALRNLSVSDEIGCVVNGLSMTQVTLEFTNGQVVCAFEIPDDIDTNVYELIIWASSSNSLLNNTQTGVIHVDSTSPRLIIELADLLRLESDQLDEVLFQGNIIESTPVLTDQLLVNWDLFRNGSIVNSQPFSHRMPIIQTDEGVYQFMQSVDLSNMGNYTIMEGDELSIWLSFYDNAGQSLTGFATENEKLLPRVTWVDFVPTISLVELRTVEPTNGESLVVATRIVNTGLASGNVTVSLIDDSGVLLDSQELFVEGGKWELIEWTIEAWRTGDIEVTVVLENYSRSEMLVIEDVAEFESNQDQLMGTLGLVVILLIITVGGFSYIYRQRSKQLEQYTKYHLEQIAIRKRERDINQQHHGAKLEEE